jgi:hypothetical protein
MPRAKCAWLFVGIFLGSGLSPVGTSFDSRWSVYIARSLWERGDTNLDEFQPAIVATYYYSTQCIDSAGHIRIGPPPECQGHWYDQFPVGGPVLESPLILAAVGGMHALHPLLRHFSSPHPVLEGFLRGDADAGHAIIELEVASLFLAATSVLLFLIARRYLSDKRAVWLTLLFAFATPAYSVAGRGLWQHTPSILLLTVTVYLLLRAEEHPALAAWAGLPVALSYTVRPTDALFCAVFTAYVALRHRRSLLRYLLAAAPVAAVFLAYNLWIYHAPLSPYYRSPLGGFLPRNFPVMAEALAGNLISPARGLLIYTPVFLFAIIAMWRAMLRRDWKMPLAPWLAALVLLHWIAISAYTQTWWAGFCYGPRFFTDVTPVFAVFLIPWLARWEKLGVGWRPLFLACALISLGMHLRGGWSTAVYDWSLQPVSVGEHPERVWDWTDPPFLR